MSIKHTPGPWNLHSPDEGDPTTGDGSFCITAQSMVIANAQPSDWHETPANARLIAAAPDLLEIVRELSQWYSEGTDERSGPFAYGLFGDEEDTTWAERVRNAIAKAEGGAK